ncbi:hypothetical protein [Janthinobacterium sp. PC23-8]|uniref:hypothetical protein n=1 Tax=Janthinobacterium sp. PC23-8 TaxID=2012679 RepID=UPI0011407CE8|nr:hypothetical protein [Janthinobacterium sp. PC23-8]
MSASQPALFNVQEFTDNGVTLVGGRLYTYAYGTTAFKAAYTDPEGTVPQTYTADGLGGQYIALNARGELPTPLYLAFGAYDIALKRADGSTVWTRRAEPTVGGAPNGALMVGADDGKAGTIFTTVAGFIAKILSSSGSALMGFIQAGIGAIGRSIQSKLRENVSLLDFMDEETRAAVASGVYTAELRAKMLIAVNAAWESALTRRHNLYAPNGHYELGEFSFPWRQSIVEELLDCKGVTLFCQGPGAVFRTLSVHGADVFQFNGVSNFSVFGYPTLTGSLLGTEGSGSNGCSITGGSKNLYLEISPNNCESIDKGTFSDGGKGATIQSDATPLQLGTITLKILAKDCYQGFGFEAGLVNFLDKAIAVDVDIVAENCFTAVAIGAGAAIGPIPPGTHTGVRVRGQSINCQKDVFLARAHGVQVDMQIVTTKTEAERRLDPRGSFWDADDLIVEALRCTYAKNSQINITGNKGDCAYKAAIGGTSAGVSGQNGATEHCNIFLDVGGTASVIDVLPVDFGGNGLSNSILEITQTTSPTLHPDFYLASRDNTLIIGPSYRLRSPTLSGRVNFALGSDGTTESAAIDIFGGVAGLQGRGTSTAGAVVAGLYDSAGNLRMGIRNGNGIVVDGATSSAPVGSYLSKLAIYNSAGVQIGYVPIYQ